MAVRVKLNERVFTLTWEEFEKAFAKATECVEILDIYETAKGGNC